MILDKIVREYDIRGVYNKTLFANDAYLIGKALGTKALQNNSNVINVAYDGRKSSPVLKNNLIKGILETGCDVNNIGLVPSPALYFSIFYLKNINYGIVITASHNPKEYNGFKIISHLENFYGKDLKKFIAFVHKEEFLTGEGKEYKIDIKTDYLEKSLLEILGNQKNLRNLKIAWDPACGAGAEIVDILSKNLSNKNFTINTKIDGDFPAHDPDPTIEANLEQLKTLVKDNNCDVGFAFDGDADRIGVVTAKGQIMWGDELVTLFASEILKETSGAKIIADVKASRIFMSKIKEYGGIPIIWKTGHSLIKAKMKQEKALLAGEMSGHVFFKDKNYGYDDGLYAAIRLIKILAETNINLDDFKESLPKTFSTKEEKIACPDEQKFTIIKKLQNTLEKEKINYLDIDGVKVEKDKGWWLIRASNTSPYLTTRCEGMTESFLKEMQQEMNDYLKKINF